MNQEQIWQDLSALPPTVRQQVIDFIAFLRNRYAQDDSAEKEMPGLREEPFVGIWRDNKAMTAARGWMRETRQI